MSADKGSWSCSAANGEVVLENAKASLETEIQRLTSTDSHLEKTVSVGTFQDANGAGKKLTLSLTDLGGEYTARDGRQR